MVFVVTAIVFTLFTSGDLASLVPTLGMFAVAALRLKPAAQSVAESLARLRYHRDSVSRLYRESLELTQGMSTPANASQTTTSEPEPFRALTLERITFTYPNATVPALAEISMEIRAGDSAGLIGRSGAGKTTLVDVLLGPSNKRRGEFCTTDGH